MFAGSLQEQALGLKNAFRVESDILLAFGLIFILSILIFPLPRLILDFGLAISLIISVLTLMVSIFLLKPLDFTSFPTLLLLSTIFRLSLNVATTRLILSHGNEGPTAAGQVVAAFGGFLMSGDVTIGVILFAILLVVNFMVITKGSSRIAEVAARFSLDAMPGKQMAIDSDMSAGLIDEHIARARRRELEDEIGFYGAMDGAAKFVRGDAIAGLLITIINIIGGLAIGLVRHGMPFAEAISTYTTLTVGDGLVSQIPTLLVSTAAGIVVTKGGLHGSTDAALVTQLGGSPKPLAMAAASAAVLAALPGLPALPFLGIAALAGAGALYRTRQRTAKDDELVTTPPLPAEAPIADTLKIDMIRLELGYGLLGLASGDTPRLTEQIKGLRKSIAMDMGFIIPPVRIQDNMQLGADTYAIKVKEIEAARGEVRPQMMLVMDPHGGVPDLPGERVDEPAFGLPAVWIAPELRDEAVFRGCTVVDPASALTTHLTEVIRQMMPELLSFWETQKLLDELSAEQRKLVSDLIPSQISIAGVQRILQLLLAEGVSIRDLPTILEGVLEICTGASPPLAVIVSHVRSRLARQISDSHIGPGGYIPLVTLSPEWEAAFAESLVGPQDDQHLGMAPSALADFMQRFRSVFESSAQAGEAPVLLTGSNIRSHVRAIVERIRPATAVLSQSEIFPRVRIRTVGMI